MHIRFPMRMRNTKCREGDITSQFCKTFFLIKVTVHTTFESNWNHELSLFFVMQIQHIMVIEIIEGLTCIIYK